jgi:hypothetical protein
MNRVFVRAKTSDGRWTAVNVADLDERSFRMFILHKIAEAGLVGAVVDAEELELTTPLTKEQVEAQP